MRRLVPAAGSRRRFNQTVARFARPPPMRRSLLSPTPPRLAGYDDVRRLARRRLPRGVFEFVDGGAGGEVTVAANRRAFARRSFDPHWLADVTGRETATTVLGQHVSLPLLLAPAGLARLAHPGGGELDAARAAAAAGTVFCVSIASSYSLEEIRAVSRRPALAPGLPLEERRRRPPARRTGAGGGLLGARADGRRARRREPRARRAQRRLAAAAGPARHRRRRRATPGLAARLPARARDHDGEPGRRRPGRGRLGRRVRRPRADRPDGDVGTASPGCAGSGTGRWR